MSGTSQTSDVFLAAVCTYLYLDDVLIAVDLTDKAVLTLDIPEEDFKILESQFAKDELTLQAKSFCKSYNALTRTLKSMRSRGDTRWDSKKSLGLV